MENNTYWNHNGRFQKEYEELWARLVPPVGRAQTLAGEALRAVSCLYHRWYNDGDRVETTMRESEVPESAVQAFNYLYQFRDPASEFSARELMEAVVEAVDEEEYEDALERAADAVIEWAVKQPDTPNDGDFHQCSEAYDFNIVSDEDNEW